MENYYKYDFHCHIHEGSKDSNIFAREQIEKLKERGFSGCLITDHDTYKGYKYIKSNIYCEDFYVLKGIEYTTVDAGHILVIMPDEYESKKIEKLGMKLNNLIEYVHSCGGILGPAHPFSEPYLSIFSSNKFKTDYDVCRKFDFIEVFNAGEKRKENYKALELAKEYHLPTTAGSDSHYIEHCGKAWVLLNETIKNNNELIEYIKQKRQVLIDGEIYSNKDRDKYDKFGKLFYFLSHLKSMFTMLINK